MLVLLNPNKQTIRLLAFQLNENEHVSMEIVPTAIV